MNMSIPDYSAHSNIGQTLLRQFVNIKSLDFPYMKVGRRILIDSDAADLWVKNRARMSDGNNIALTEKEKQSFLDDE